MSCQPFDDMEILFYSKGRCWRPGNVETGGRWLVSWHLGQQRIQWDRRSY